MKFILQQRFIALTILLGMVGLLSFCVTGLFLIDMDTMAMGDCPMTHQTTLCPMAMIERLSIWQQLLVPTSFTIAILAIVLFGATLTLSFGFKVLSHTTSPPQFWRRLFEALISFYDYLIQQFSEGILHPKIY